MWITIQCVSIYRNIRQLERCVVEEWNRVSQRFFLCVAVVGPLSRQTEVTQDFKEFFFIDKHNNAEIMKCVILIWCFTHVYEMNFGIAIIFFLKIKQSSICDFWNWNYHIKHVIVFTSLVRFTQNFRTYKLNDYLYHISNFITIGSVLFEIFAKIQVHSYKFGLVYTVVEGNRIH